MVEFTRKEYNIISKNRGIIEPQKMATQELINTPNMYDSRSKEYLEKINENRTRKNCQKTEYFKKWIKLSWKAAKNK